MDSQTHHSNLSTRERIDILLAEYQALYDLVTFRMVSLDRRAPLAGAAFSATLGGIAVLPQSAQVVYLSGLPIALVWFLRTTGNHARSFEDVLRRLDEIERRINEIAGENLLAFQSSHPSRGRAVGGRTGNETMFSSFFTCLVLLAACVYYAHDFVLPAYVAGRYDEYALIVLTVLVFSLVRHRQYRYEKQPPPIRLSDAGR